jgi:hypothetical protein
LHHKKLKMVRFSRIRAKGRIKLDPPKVLSLSAIVYAKYLICGGMEKSLGLHKLRKSEVFCCPRKCRPSDDFHGCESGVRGFYALRSSTLILTGLSNPELSNKTGYCHGKVVEKSTLLLRMESPEQSRYNRELTDTTVWSWSWLHIASWATDTNHDIGAGCPRERFLRLRIRWDRLSRNLWAVIGCDL